MIKLLVDGYNAIFCCEQFAEVEESSGLQAARAALCHDVSLRRGDEAVVVFDGAADTTLPQRTRVSSVQVIFSSSRHTADEEMVKLLRQHEDPSAVTAVTSDSELSAKIKALGAKTVKTEEFFKETEKPRKQELHEPRVKFEGPGPEELQYWMRVFKCTEE